MLYNNTSWKLMIMILEHEKDSYALLNCLVWNQDLLMHDLCQNSDIVLWKYWTDNWNHFKFCCHHRNDFSSGGFRSADFVCHREIGRLWEAEEGVWGDLCRTERDGGTHSGTTEDIPKHVSKRGKSIYKSLTSCVCFFYLLYLLSVVEVLP